VYNVGLGASITKEIEAVYEQGMIRPLQPLELPEGARLDVIVITHEQPRTNGNTAEVLAEIAALPLEGSTDAFAGRDHDSVLYSEKQVK
jgi:predicted DNA-binding antitoxin AbrB/MazE fold protein